jgi:hypothetical protein
LGVLHENQWAEGTSSTFVGEVFYWNLINFFSNGVMPNSPVITIATSITLQTENHFNYGRVHRRVALFFCNPQHTETPINGPQEPELKGRPRV